MMLDIIIPCAGSARYVEKTLLSALAQSPCPEAVYVVDNACGHAGYRDAAMKAGSDRVHYIRFEQRLSMTLNWQRCLGVGSSDLCMLLNDDDWLMPGALAAGMEVLEKASEKSCVLLPRIYTQSDDDTEIAEATHERQTLSAIDRLPEPARAFYLSTASLNHMSALIFRRGPRGFPLPCKWLPDQAYFFAHAAEGGVELALESGAMIRTHADSLTSSDFKENGRALYEERAHLRMVIEFFVEERDLKASDLEAVARLSPKYFFRRLVRACFSWPWRRSRMHLGREIVQSAAFKSVLKEDLTGIELLWPAGFSTMASLASDLKYFLDEKRFSE